VEVDLSWSGVTSIGGIGGSYFHPAAQTCLYSISPTRKLFKAAGGTGYVNVTAESICSWTAETDVNWITITSDGSGTGNGTVSYSVAPNTTRKPRKGTMTIAGETFPVWQSKR
jgi:hypothetical protein